MSSRKKAAPPIARHDVRSSTSQRRLPKSLELGRRLGSRAMLFHQAIAEQFGLNTTDLKCWDLAGDEVPITAGRLAELTGLTSGAVTAVVDRLERAGFVRRQPDPEDRRRILIWPVPERGREVGRLFESFARSMTEMASRYTPEQRGIIDDFMQRSEQIFYEETLKLRRAGGVEGEKKLVARRP